MKSLLTSWRRRLDPLRAGGGFDAPLGVFLTTLLLAQEKAGAFRLIRAKIGSLSSIDHTGFVNSLGLTTTSGTDFDGLRQIKPGERRAESGRPADCRAEFRSSSSRARDRLDNPFPPVLCGALQVMLCPSIVIVSVAICLAAVMSSVGSAIAEEVDVYILAGQSNMDGRGQVAELEAYFPEYAQPDPHVDYWYANPYGRGYSTGWISLAPGYSIAPGFKRGPQTLPAATFGMEVVFGPKMAELSEGRRIAIVKVSKGGTNLRQDWDPVESEGDMLYPLLIETVEAALKALVQQGDRPQLKGMLWHQGESDHTNRSYAEQLVQFVAQLRADLSEPALPVAIGAVYRHEDGKRDDLRQRQLDAAETIPYATHVSSDGLTTYDSTHFDTASLVEFGQRMATAMTEVQAEVPKN